MTEVMLFRRRKSVAARRVVVIPRRDTRPGIILFFIFSINLIVIISADSWIDEEPSQGKNYQQQE